MKDIKQIVSESLIQERQRKLNESLSVLENISDEEFLVEKYLKITTDLLVEGYSVNEIEKSAVAQKLSNVDLKKTLTGAGASAVKEYVISFVLRYVFGAGDKFSKAVSIVFADYDARHLLRPFKSKKLCDQHFPELSAALIELIVRNVMTDQLNVGSSKQNLRLGGMATVFGGNIFGEVIRDTEIPKIVSDKFCNLIHRGSKDDDEE